MRARNPLYVMAKPPPHVAAQIAALPRNDPKRGPELLHVTLLLLFDLALAPPGWLSALIAALDAFEGHAFPLAFDRIEERRAVTLRTRAPLEEARAFQAALIRFLLERRAPCLPGTTPVPHVTINYRGDGRGAQKITAIGWTVTEILLIESVVGKTTHREHGRWPLRGRRPTRHEISTPLCIIKTARPAIPRPCAAQQHPPSPTVWRSSAPRHGGWQHIPLSYRFDLCSKLAHERFDPRPAPRRLGD